MTRRRYRYADTAATGAVMAHRDVAAVVGSIVVRANSPAANHADLKSLTWQFPNMPNIGGVLEVARKAGLIELDVEAMTWTPTPYGRHMHNAWSVG